MKSAPLGKRFAISIGINAHPWDHETPPLLHAEDDAQAFDMALNIDIPKEQRVLLLGQRATWPAIHQELRGFLQLSHDKHDTVIFYYAGYIVPLVKNVREDVGRLCLDALLATPDLDNLSDGLALPGMHTLRNEFIDQSRSRHQLFILDCYYPETLAPNDIRWMSERLHQLTKSGFPGHGSLLSWHSAQHALDPHLSMQRLSHYLLKALRGETPEALRETSLTAQSLHAYICTQLLAPNQHPTLTYRPPDDFVIIPHIKKTMPERLHTNDTNFEDFSNGGDNADDTEKITIEIETVLPLEVIESDPPNTSLVEDLEGTKIFICHSEHDEKYLSELQTHLSYHVGKKRITYWDKTQIQPGSNWRDDTEQAVSSAHIGIILVSAELMMANTHEDSELSLLLRRAKHDKISIIPVLTRHVVLDHTELNEIKFMNKGDPLNGMSRAQRDKLWAQVTHMVLAKSKPTS